MNSDILHPGYYNNQSVDIRATDAQSKAVPSREDSEGRRAADLIEALETGKGSIKERVMWRGELFDLCTRLHSIESGKYLPFKFYTGDLFIERQTGRTYRVVSLPYQNIDVETNDILYGYREVDMGISKDAIKGPTYLLEYSQMELRDYDLIESEQDE